jgi:hypothetical protein
VGLQPVDLVEVACFLGRVDGGDEPIDRGRRLGRVGSPAHRGADHHQRFHQVGMGKRHIQRHPAAHRVADHGRRAHPRRRQHRERVVDGRVGLGDVHGLAEPPAVEGDGPMPRLREGVDQPTPAAPVTHSGVEQHDVRSAGPTGAAVAIAVPAGAEHVEGEVGLA